MHSIKSKLLLYLLLLGILAALISGGVQVYQFQQHVLNKIKDELTQVMTHLPSALDPAVILNGVNPDFSENENFKKTMKFLRSTAKTMKLTYLYTLVPNEKGEFVFSLDANDNFPWDEFANLDPSDPNAQGTVYQEIPKKALDIWEKGEITVLDEFYTDHWGTFLSAFHPVKDANGQKIYLLGADIQVDDFLARIFEAWLGFFVALIISILISTLLAFSISTQLSRPIIQLKDVALRLAEKDFNVDIPLPKEKNELYQLSLAYQTMAREIQNYTTHLEELVEERTQKLKKANQELKLRQEEMERDLRLAQRIQHNILPSEKNYPQRNEIEFGSVYQSLAAVGGDFFDIIRRGKNQYGLLIADVSGHGVQAALITTMAKVSFNANSGYNVPPGEICTKVNHDLIQLLGGEPTHFVTAYFGSIDLETGEFSYTNAGHHPAVLIREYGKEILRLGNPSPFLGMFPNTTFSSESLHLKPGDTIILFTDGIIEAMNPNKELYDEERLIAFLSKNAQLDSKNLVEGLLEDVKQFCNGQPPNDDRAVLLMRFLGEHRMVVETRNLPREESTLLKEKFQEAISLVKDKHFHRALPIFEEIYSVMPTNPKVVNNYAVVLCKLKEFKKAYEILQKALHENSDNTELLSTLNYVKERL